MMGLHIPRNDNGELLMLAVCACGRARIVRNHGQLDSDQLFPVIKTISFIFIEPS